MKKQALNPYLPLNVCIPDGEPHVFGDRLYVYGSHDEEGGTAFCVLDYEVWSAPLDDLGDWRCEGTIYRAAQDPAYGKPNQAMYAPDVVQGPDGRYYLYYAMSGATFTDPIHVAVCDTPAGQYEYYGEVRNADGSTFTKNITFDPGVLNDNGRIYLYYGWSLAVSSDRARAVLGEDNMNNARSSGHAATRIDQLVQVQMMMFGKSETEVRTEPGIMGANVVELDADMLTVIDGPKRIVPGQFDSFGTEYEGHSFFEASSIRKIGDTYYFIYSSENQHELCYATSAYPDQDFHYGGVIVSSGDIGIGGRKPEERLAMTGNNHGSLVNVKGQWYMFYHRPTHKTTYSRQGLAEKVVILPDGSIPQVEITSCGLNDGPLKAEGTYPAPIACHITNGHMPHVGTQGIDADVPFVTHCGAEHFIADIKEDTTIGYKYFDFDGAGEYTGISGTTLITLTLCGTGSGVFDVYTDEEKLGEIPVTPSDVWQSVSTAISVSGTHGLYLKYRGEGALSLRELIFE